MQQANKNIAVLKKEETDLKVEIASKQKYLEAIEKTYDFEKKTIKTNLDEFYQNEKTSLSLLLQEVEKNTREGASAAHKEYLDILADFSNQVLDKSQELSSLKEKADIIINKSKEELLKKEHQDFYKITLNDNELSDISEFAQIKNRIFHKDVVNKILWKTFYEKPTNFLIGRILDSKNVCGIYKITNVENKMSYIGQSVNVADRLKQHIKKGLGAESSSKNKLYTEMEKYGVHNFSFELIQECPREKLNELERYWIDFYQTKSFGYNSTSGNK